MSHADSPSLVSRAKVAFQRASAKVLSVAEATGTPVVIWEDGAVREVDPKEMRRRLAAKATQKPKAKKKLARRSSAESSRRKKRAS